jgi:hypothetical protein
MSLMGQGMAFTPRRHHGSRFNMNRHHTSPRIGLPIGVSRDARDISLFFYMSFEHPFNPR